MSKVDMVDLYTIRKWLTFAFFQVVLQAQQKHCPLGVAM